MSIRNRPTLLRRPRDRGVTLLELLIVAILVGIMATVGALNYTRAVRRSWDREAESYLQALRRAAQAFHEMSNAYPTALTQVPQVFVPPATETSSHWTYSFSGTNPAVWTLPTATSKVANDNRKLQILENGTIQ